MNVAEILKNEFAILKSSTYFQKVFHVILLVWLVSIPAKNSFYQISVVLIPMTSIYYAFLSGQAKVSPIIFARKYCDFLIAFFFILASMSVSNTLSELADWKSWISMLKFFSRYTLVLFSLLYLYEEKIFTRKIFVIFILLALSIYGLHGVYEVIVTKGAQPIQGLVYNTNPFGLTMLTGVMTATLGLIYLIKEKSSALSFVPLLCLLIVFTISLLFSESRSSWLAAGLFIIILGGFNINLIRQNKKLITIISIITFSIICFNNGLLTRFFSIFSFSEPYRFAIWKNAISLIIQRPLFGYGMVDYASIGIATYGGTHNSILEILLYTGLLGLAAYATVMIVTVKEIISIRKYELLPVVFAFILISQFNLSVMGNKIFLSILTAFSLFLLSHRTE